MHQGSMSIKFVCNKCGKQFVGQDNLRRHILYVYCETPEQVKYACNQCDKQFTQQGNLTTHIKKKHL